MKVLIASDKFKDALSQQQVNRIISEAVMQWDPDITVECVALSDGGDGFLDVVSEALPGSQRVQVDVHDPLGRKVRAEYLADTENKTAYFELAVASGLALLKPEERRVTATSTYGTGELVRHAVSRGAVNLYFGLGGSATNDAGMGIASAMGFQFLNTKGEVLEAVGGSLARVASIRPPESFPLPLRVFAVNDVNNPLFGDQGAARVYAAQKGAIPEEIEALDKGLRHFSEIVHSELQKEAAFVKGSGAAGGTAYGLKVFFDASFINGAEFILNLKGVKQKLQQGYYDLVITGEGSIDQQTPYGKLIAGLGRAAAPSGTPVIAFCGVNSLSIPEARDMGIKQIIPVSDKKESLRYNLDHAGELLAHMVQEYLQANF